MLVDQFGNSIASPKTDKKQTSNIRALENVYLASSLNGITPSKLQAILREADEGNLLAQHRLFSDMEERDTHLRAEMDKRKNAVMGLPWQIVPPRDASSAEKKAAEWAQEILTDAVDPIEDAILGLMDGVGHGFSAVELGWRRDGNEWLPSFFPRPQEWFKLSQNKVEFKLNDGTIEGQALLPFCWLMHTHGKAKTGYLGRMGLYRSLVWPFLYKAYSLGDFAEYLEIFGLPIIVGKYHAGATEKEKNSLLNAVAQLGHNARGIMSQEMGLEINKVVSSGGDAPHLAMMEWADKAQSKAILGQTLSTDTGSKGGGSFALGKVHNEVRHDIRNSDARQIAATLTRDLIYPLIALNRGDVKGLARCPRFVFDTSEPEDLKLFADALPKLVQIGLPISAQWAHEKLNIPIPKEGEAVLALQSKKFDGENNPKQEQDAQASALSEDASAGASLDNLDNTSPVEDEAEQANQVTDTYFQHLLSHITQIVNDTSNLKEAQQQILNFYGYLLPDELSKIMQSAFVLAELKGMQSVVDEHAE